MRQPNEVLVSVKVLEQLLSRGIESWPLRVVKGVDPEARIINAHAETALDTVTLVYDRPVEEPVIQEMESPPFRVSWTEEMLQDKDLNIRDLVRAKLHTTEIP